MHPVYVERGAVARPVPIWFVTNGTWAALRDRIDASACAFADAVGFEPQAGRHMLLPGDGGLAGVLFGLDGCGKPKDPFLAGRLPGVLPAGTYRFGNAPPDPRLASLAFALGTYRFTRYRKADAKEVRL